jgi:hypothetical protein
VKRRVIKSIQSRIGALGAVTLECGARRVAHGPSHSRRPRAHAQASTWEHEAHALPLSYPPVSSVPTPSTSIITAYTFHVAGKKLAEVYTTKIKTTLTPDRRMPFRLRQVGCVPVHPSVS